MNFLLRRSARVLVGAAAAVVVGAICAPAHALGPDDFCSSQNASRAATAENLESVADSVWGSERSAPASGQGWRSALNVGDIVGPVPSERALAAYCAAAGYAAARGLEPQAAKAYLRSAIVHADRARAALWGARSVYALSGLISYRGESDGRVRGASRGNGSAIADLNSLELFEDHCAGVYDPQTGAPKSGPLRLLACAASKAEDARDWDLAARAELRLAVRLARLNGYDGAAPYSTGIRSVAASGSAGLRRLIDRSLENSRRFADQIGPQVDRYAVLGAIAEESLNIQGAGSSADVERIARNLAGSSDAKYRALAASLDARLALLSGDTATARGAIGHAIFLEMQRPQPLRLPDWYMVLAQVEVERKAEYVRAAYLALENVRQMMPGSDPVTDTSTFSAHMRPVFEAAADVQLAQSGGASEDIQTAQTIFEAYREAELKNAFGDDCVPHLPPLQATNLKENEVVLYPVLLSDRVELIYARGGSGRGFERAVPNRDYNRAKVQALVAKLRSALIDRRADWRDAAQPLYEVLIQPVAQYLGRGSNLAIVPDGVLRTLPFSALTDAHGRYLIQQTRLSVEPALLYAQPGQASSGRSAFVLAAALKGEVSLPVGRFAKLQGAASEADTAVQGSRGLSLRDFSRAGLTEALRKYRVDVLHLATHAAFNGRSEQSFIVADKEVIPLSELRSILNENLVREGGLDLLVLSACDTAVGDDDASMGLAGAAVQSGARSSLASLWPVDNAGTIELMKHFYRAYETGQSKSGALQAAQLALIDPDHGGSQPYTHPYYWAAFTMIGGWR